jgi:DNA-binding NtrC family response regulator
MIRILVVDDEPRGADLLRRELADRGHAVEARTSSTAALARLAEARFDLVITDLRMPPPDGLALLAEIKRAWPATSDPDGRARRRTTAVQAMRAGAPTTKKDPRRARRNQVRIERLLEARGSRAERGRRPAKSRRCTGTGGHRRTTRSPARRSPQSRRPTRTCCCAASGTGKDLFARAIHFDSPRSAGPWVKVNCAAIPENLLESELFGHERGAFTGAVTRKLGRFEQADGGTIFLDEIGELSPALQVKLLQVLEEKAFVRVGGSETRTVDVRIVAATNRDLEGESARDGFARTCSTA